MTSLLVSPYAISGTPRLHRFALLFVYVLANIYAAWLFIDAGATTNEFSGLSVTPSGVFSACIVALFVLCAFTLVAQPTLTWLAKHLVKPKSAPRSGMVGLAIFSVISAHLVFALGTGTQVAGQLIYIDTAWAFFFLLFNSDYLFLAFYCFYRESKWFYATFALFILLSVLRGWGGAFLIYGFLEIGRLISSRKYWHVLLVSVAIMLLAPTINTVRNNIRAIGFELQGVEMLSVFSPDLLRSDSDEAAPLVSLLSTLETILLRLQHIEVDLVVSANSETITSLYDNGLIRPFYAEGSIGHFFYWLLNESIVPDLHLFLPRFFHGTYQDVGYNVHAGFGSWLTILGLSFPYVLLYACLMMLLAAVLLRWNAGSREANDVAWLATLLFICSGWFSPYEAFLQALILLIGMEMLFVRISFGLKRLIAQAAVQHTG